MKFEFKVTEHYGLWAKCIQLSGLWEFRLKSEFRFFFLNFRLFLYLCVHKSIGDFKISDFSCHFQTFLFLVTHTPELWTLKIGVRFEVWCSQSSGKQMFLLLLIFSSGDEGCTMSTEIGSNAWWWKLIIAFGKRGWKC